MAIYEDVGCVTLKNLWYICIYNYIIYICSSYHPDILWYIYIDMYDIAPETSSLQIIISHSQRQRQAIKEHLDEFLGSIFDVRLVPDNVGKTMGKSPKSHGCEMFRTSCSQQKLLRFWCFVIYHGIMFCDPIRLCGFESFEYRLRNQRPPMGNRKLFRIRATLQCKARTAPHQQAAGWSCGSRRSSKLTHGMGHDPVTLW